MSWLVRYTFTPDKAEDFAWDLGQESYEEVVSNLDDVLIFLTDFDDSITSFSCLKLSETCSQPTLSHQEVPLSTMFSAPSAESTTEKNFPGLAAILGGGVNNQVGTALAVVLLPILAAAVIPAILLR